MKALREVETSGSKNEGRGAIGDNGRALGPYQIWEVYYIDAVSFDKSLTGKWRDCLTDKSYSERVIRAYIRRYLPPGGSVEDAARIHNGGPQGYKKPATLTYLEKFKKAYYPAH